MERFWSKVQKTKTCWLWKAAKTQGGYGLFWFNKRMSLAHRVAYEMLIGPIAEELQIDHLCKTVDCVNPAHLEAVTQAENMARSSIIDHNIVKTHCPRGHEYNENNTYVWDGHRSCRECKRILERLRYHKRPHMV